MLTLMLSRRPGEDLVIRAFGEEIRVALVRVRDDRAWIGFEAPRDIKILRREIAQKRSARP